jgi:hypothetical protein
MVFRALQNRLGVRLHTHHSGRKSAVPTVRMAVGDFPFHFNEGGGPLASGLWILEALLPLRPRSVGRRGKTGASSRFEPSVEMVTFFLSFDFDVRCRRLRKRQRNHSRASHGATFVLKRSDRASTPLAPPSSAANLKCVQSMIAFHRHRRSGVRREGTPPTVVALTCLARAARSPESQATMTVVQDGSLWPTTTCLTESGI